MKIKRHLFLAGFAFCFFIAGCTLGTSRLGIGVGRNIYQTRSGTYLVRTDGWLYQLIGSDKMMVMPDIHMMPFLGDLYVFGDASF